MAIKLEFDIPKERRDKLPTSDIAGRVGVYFMGENDKMAKEQEGLVFTRLDEETRDALVELIGEDEIIDGPEEDEYGFILFTALTSIEGITAHRVETGFMAFAGNGPPIRVCDGETYKDEDGDTAPCFCVNTLGCSTVKEIKDKKAACNLSLQLLFSIDGLADKVFQMRTGSEKALPYFEEARVAFEDGEKTGVLTVEQVRYTRKDGKAVSFSFAYPELGEF